MYIYKEVINIQIYLNQNKRQVENIHTNSKISA
jgi:hypothetical protein